jgi:uncharacterized protein YciI
MKRLWVAMLILALFGSFSVAGERGEDRFWFCFLETGKPTPPDKEAVAKMQKAHLDNFGKLFNEGKLFAAGPLADPSKKKRGIIVLKGNGRKDLDPYFAGDPYVAEGYMTLNAVPCKVRKALGTTEIDPNGIEEVRIILLTRPRQPLTKKEQKASDAYLQSLIDGKQIGAWYSLDSGEFSEIMFARTTDDAMLKSLMMLHPSFKESRVEFHVWKQYLGKGVLK